MQILKATFHPSVVSECHDVHVGNVESPGHLVRKRLYDVLYLLDLWFVQFGGLGGRNVAREDSDVAIAHIR
jgi:hypothetical protein